MDNYFHYPYYYFSYLPGGCVLSPFYYYHHLPGYISYSRIRVGIFNFILIHDHHYDWRRPRYTNYLSWQGYGIISPSCMWNRRLGSSRSSLIVIRMGCP